jgi:hypothetical protein
LKYLLLQMGIDALSGGAFMTDGAAHAWALVKIDGTWFHLDATFESTATGGAGLSFFGMDDNRRIGTGVTLPISTDGTEPVLFDTAKLTVCR